MLLRDRRDGGRRLADELADTALVDPVVLGLARGGVPVAAEIAPRLGAPLEVFVARKVGAPGHEEFGIGAVAEGYDGLIVTAAVERLGISDACLGELAERARRESARRVRVYRDGRPLPELDGRDVIVVDDGLATGVTAEAALRALANRRPRRLIVAAPVCTPHSAQRLATLADKVVCVLMPDELLAVGAWYLNFRPVTDEEVLTLLNGPTRQGTNDSCVP